MKLSDNPFYKSTRAPQIKKDLKPPKECLWEKSFWVQMDELEKSLLVKALTEAKGSPTLAGKLCGMGYTTFQMKMKRFDLKCRDYVF